MTGRLVLQASALLDASFKRSHGNSSFQEYAEDFSISVQVGERLPPQRTQVSGHSARLASDSGL